MRAVWSLWTKPLRASNRLGWLSEKYHVLAWVLSVETARKHYPETSLFTDDEGAEMLIDGIGLEFRHVSTDLNLLDAHDPDWWAFGKIYTYSFQSEPFVHIDNDVFLWHPLPQRLESAPVFAQNPEVFTCGSSFYCPEKFEFAIDTVNGWIPEELKSYISIGGIQRAVSCGIIGGNRVDFLRYYADLAKELIEHPRNQSAWVLLGNKISDNIIFEQYLLAACIDYHQNKERSPYRDMNIQFLFDSYEDALNNAAQAGYTHLIGDAKKNGDLLKRLEKRVRRDYPEHYERCIKYIRDGGRRGLGWTRGRPFVN